MKADRSAEADALNIQQRVQRISNILAIQQKEFGDTLKAEFEKFMRRMDKNKMGPQKFEESYQCLSQFVKSSYNLAQVFFPLLSDPSFISLQREAVIESKVQEFKKTVLKSFNSICSQLNHAREPNFQPRQVQKCQQAAKKSKKPSNLKTPIEYSVVLTEWLLKNFNNPYPSNEEKDKLAEESGLSVGQVNNWFINSRERVIKKYMKLEPKEQSRGRRSQEQH